MPLVSASEQNQKKVQQMLVKNDKPARKDDRRTQKTKTSLALALKDLILEKGWDAVTVQDIIDRANVGRSTFYAHYERKEQLLVGNINFQHELVDPPGNSEDYPMGINLAYLFHHTQEHLALVRALRGTQGCTIIVEHFTELCKTKILECHKPKMQRSKAAQKLFCFKADAAAGAIVRMLFKWLEDGAQVPADEMVPYATRILVAVMEVSPGPI
jgi:AcrR family transcriptional regulator